MKIILISSLMIFSLSAMSAIKPEKIEIEGVSYEVLTSSSVFSGRPAPLLVIAPAKKYTMVGELFEDLAEKASKLGYFVVRFNWGFVTKNNEPSKGLSAESKDLERVIKHYSNQPYVDSSKVILAAKSFGSRVAMKDAYKLANSLLLMTPNCDKKDTFKKNYKPIFKLKKNVHIVISKDDPYCDVGQIYQDLSKLNKKYVTVHTLAGDHNFKLEGVASRLNEKVAIESSLNWLGLQL